MAEATAESIRFNAFARQDYYQELSKRISRAKPGDRVVVATMSFKPEKPGLKPIIEALRLAAERGVKVELIVDAYPFIINDGRPGPLFFKRTLPETLPEPYRTRKEVLDSLQASGGSFTIINWPERRFQNPFGNRSHIKLAIIGDYSYIGGCNLNARDQIDVMVSWEDKKSADWLYELTRKIIKSKSVSKALNRQDTSFKIDDSTKLLVDAGIPGQSVIYQKAIELIDSAEEEILMTCQYFPSGTTTQHLHLAEKRGVKVKIIFGNPAQHPIPFNLLHHSVKHFEKLRRPPNFFNHELPKGGESLHAKVLISEKAAMVGSHNYVPAGVKWGTAEAALYSVDPKFGQQLQETIQK